MSLEKLQLPRNDHELTAFCCGDVLFVTVIVQANRHSVSTVTICLYSIEKEKQCQGGKIPLLLGHLFQTFCGFVSRTQRHPDQVITQRHPASCYFIEASGIMLFHRHPASCHFIEASGNMSFHKGIRHSVISQRHPASCYYVEASGIMFFRFVRLETRLSAVFEPLKPCNVSLST